MAKLKGEVAKLARLAGYGGKIKTDDTIKPASSSIGTSKAHAFYVRPEIKAINDQDAKDIRANNPEPVGKNVWLIQIKPPFKRGMPHMAVVLLKEGKQHYLMIIPCQKDGRISMEAMAARLMDTTEGSRDGKERNMFVDLAVNANDQYRPDDKGGTYVWYMHPNESDVVGIDNVGSKVVNVIGGVQGGKVGRTLIIAGGTEAERRSLADTIKANFTAKEKKVLSGTMIVIGDAGVGAAGYFKSNTDSNGKLIGVPTIVIDRAYVRKSDVMIHEAVHALRQFDENRPNQLSHVKRYYGNDADLEESLTEAETVTRQRPLDKHENTAGYYGYVRRVVDNPRDADAKKVSGKGNYIIVSDRLTVNDIAEAEKFAERGRKGKRAFMALLKNYPSMHISRMKYRGTSEAIDTYHRAHSPAGAPGMPAQTANIQVYSPDATPKTTAIRRKEAKAITSGKVVEYQDGKAVRIQ